MRIVGPVWKEWWREVLAGWRRNEMSCLVGGCNRICSVLAGQAGNDGFGCCQIRTSCFRVWKTEAAKKHLAIDWLATVAGEWKWKMLAGWRRKRMC